MNFLTGLEVSEQGGKKSVMMRNLFQDEIVDAFKLCFDEFVRICPECTNPEIKMDWKEKSMNDPIERGYVEIIER